MIFYESKAVTEKSKPGLTSSESGMVEADRYKTVENHSRASR
jgi:hypothetical protein